VIFFVESEPSENYLIIKDGIMNKKKLKWIDKKDFKKYTGKWVGLCDNKIIASSKDAGYVIDNLKKNCGDKETSIVRIPERGQVLLL